VVASPLTTTDFHTMAACFRRKPADCHTLVADSPSPAARSMSAAHTAAKAIATDPTISLWAATHTDYR
jgi:hypothetical protein